MQLAVEDVTTLQVFRACKINTYENQSNKKYCSFIFISNYIHFAHSTENERSSLDKSFKRDLKACVLLIKVTGE